MVVAGVIMFVVADEKAGMPEAGLLTSGVFFAVAAIAFIVYGAALLIVSSVMHAWIAKRRRVSTFAQQPTELSNIDDRKPT
jgi:hypothetical protein